MKRMIFVKNKEGEYPIEWNPLHYSKGEFWLGGGHSTPILIYEQKDVPKIMYQARKEMKRFNLIYYTKKLFEWEE